MGPPGASVRLASPSAMALIFPLILIVAVYFLMLRPQQQRVARQRALVNSIEVGDEVVTAGGIVGRVRRFDDDRATLEIATGVEITLLRGAIAQKMAPDSSSGAEASGADAVPGPAGDNAGSGENEEDAGF